MANNTTGTIIWWTDICGYESPLWDEAVTIHTANPDLTQCLQDTLLAWLPCGYLLLTSLVYLPLLLAQSTRHSFWDVSIFNTVKVLFCLLLCVLEVVDLSYAVVQLSGGEDVPPSKLIKPAVYLLSMMAASFLIHVEFRKGHHSEGVLFYYWLLLACVNIVPARSLGMRGIPGGPNNNTWTFILFYIFYALVLVELLLTLFADKKALPNYYTEVKDKERIPLLAHPNKKAKEKVNPITDASFLSRILFAWITKLMWQGSRRTLVYDDLWPLTNENTCQTIIPKFEREWKRQLQLTDWKVIKPRHHKDNETTKYQKDISDSPDHAKASRQKEPSSWRALVWTFGSYYMLGGFYKMIYDLLTFISPVILDLLISFVEGRGAATYLWSGYVYAAVLFIVASVKTVILHNYHNVCFLTGMRVRTAVIGAVYRKALRLSSSSRHTVTVGEIVNLMSVDAQKLLDATPFMHMFWSAPLTMALAIYFLWQQLGPSCMAGLVAMLLLVPLNAIIAQKTRVLQMEQMKQKDERIKNINEVLNGIKVLKLYAWEESFQKKILEVRAKELVTLRKVAYLTAWTALSWLMAPYLVSLASFAVYVMVSPYNILDAGKAFVSLALFNTMNYPLAIMPRTITSAINGAVSVGRITRFLKNEEIDPENVTHHSHADESISINNGTFSWSDDDPPVLHDIHLSVPEGNLVAVVGQVGSGKSSLISALLGEMEVTKGIVNVKGTVAYVPQQAWIQNMTLRDNILFGKPYHAVRYQKVIEACALTPDLDILPGGDQTEIGERGINLSGGQKQRVSLARAVYQDCDLYLLDDPLSAVDAHVGKHIFDHIVGPRGLLRHKTRFFVTNSIFFLPEVDSIVVLNKGRINEQGPYKDLLSRRGAFSDLISTYLKEAEDELTTLTDESHQERLSECETNVGGSISMMRSSRGTRSRQISLLSGKSLDGFAEEANIKKTRQELTQEEKAATGNVSLSVFLEYARCCGLRIVGVYVLLILLFMVTQIAGNLWLTEWTNDEPVNGTQDLSKRDLRLGVYGGIGVLQAIACLSFSFALAVATVNASHLLHTNLLLNIMRAPMAYFDTTPLGRIMNRFSRELDIVDVNMPQVIRIWTSAAAGILIIIFVISYSTAIFLTVVIPLCVLYFFIQRFYIATSRQLRRIESVRLSPIYNHFGESISGATSIRAYRKQEMFIDHSDTLLDNNQSVYYPSIISQRWVGIWLETIGNAVVLMAAVFAVLGKDNLNAGLVGLSVSYALQMTFCTDTFIRASSDLETYIVSVERMQEYTECPKEAPARIPEGAPPGSWPSEGRVEIRDYSTRYRPGLETVLKGINCTIQPSEKVGIIGRTGAGKSSLTLALFRIIEASSGSVLIDGRNIADMGLYDLRSKLTIIPQDPVVFSGSLRHNLDPFEMYGDEDTWQALDQAHLKTFAKALPGGLMFDTGEDGSNLSVGQRQLLCLARALLRKTKILVLDEATAAVDLETDELIQTTIRTEFKECTVITIAHRLNTILDYDRVMVLSNGEINQFDSPAQLMEDKDGIFYGMAKDAGLL